MLHHSIHIVNIFYYEVNIGYIVNCIILLLKRNDIPVLPLDLLIWNTIECGISKVQEFGRIKNALLATEKGKKRCPKRFTLFYFNANRNIAFLPLFAHSQGYNHTHRYTFLKKEHRNYYFYLQLKKKTKLPMKPDLR